MRTGYLAVLHLRGGSMSYYATSQPPLPSEPPSPTKRARWYRRPVPAATAALVAGLVIGGSIGAASGGGSKTKTVAGPTVVSTTTAPAPAPVTATATVTKTATPPPPPGPATSFGDGTYLVGTDIRAGLYKTEGVGDGTGCYWERDKDLSGGLDSIIANDNISGPTTVQIASSDKAFKSNGGCEWKRVG
jgi:hypothetical protein